MVRKLGIVLKRLHISVIASLEVVVDNKEKRQKSFW